MAAFCHIFGIRHHGPGSARSLLGALKALNPDCILVEGPPEGESVLSWVTESAMKPPVALLIYQADKPQHSAFYPFAIFSPEWQAIRFALERQVPVRFMDLPQSIQMAQSPSSEPEEEAADPAHDELAPADQDPNSPEPGLKESESGSPAHLCQDPIGYLARAAGYSDSERWWEHMVEQRQEAGDIFPAILEAMKALRDAAIPSSLQSLEPEREAQREAWMRQTMREALKDGFQRIAIVCGAWHSPALATLPPAKSDAALLKGLPRIKVNTTWIPWTYRRLAYSSGYGAGIESPGWYDFLFGIPMGAPACSRAKTVPADRTAAPNLATRWLAKVARLLREEDLDASSASVIETVRLAESIAALRGRPLPGLPELNEATQTVLCFGDSLPLQVIREKLIISDRLGTVPENTPMVPLAQDLAREQKRLRLAPEATHRLLDLDMRKPNDLERSRLLHRLNLLGVPWGKAQRGSARQQGTFHEHWALQWQPEFAVSLIEAGVWGNTIFSAATAKAIQDGNTAPDLPALTSLLDAALLADLSEAVEHLMRRLQAEAAVAADVLHLMGALSPLANILRYGNVRQTDASMVATVVDGLVARICIGLPGACGSLNDAAAEDMFEHLQATHAALGILQNPSHFEAWIGVLTQLSNSPNLHGLISGRSTRLLLEAKQYDTTEAARRLSLALSAANPPVQAAAWIEGFLRGSGMLLVHDEGLWKVLDDWVAGLSRDHFETVLALLRRTFATFESGERRQMAQRVARRAAGPVPERARMETGFNEERANRSLPLIERLLGLEAGLLEKPDDKIEA